MQYDTEWVKVTTGTDMTMGLFIPQLVINSWWRRAVLTAASFTFSFHIFIVNNVLQETALLYGSALIPSVSGLAVVDFTAKLGKEGFLSNSIYVSDRLPPP